MDNSEKELNQLKACYDAQGLLLRYPSKKALRPPVYLSGSSMEHLADTYFLSLKSIQRIIRR